ncbi:alpha/beta fold hydrolase [Embleya sp. AB8]|uniref:alpha/beta fold hydrolase n=1 Tax=Embleya sp. AB8 TaxID=3156304 RepID=UPI003C762B72
MRVSIGDIRLYFDVDGPKVVPYGPIMVERPTLVLVHGGPGADHSSFKPAMYAAARFAQVVYLDQRGSGRSDRGDPGSWTWERWADDVIAFCDVLDIPAPVLVGTAEGGRVALTAALRHPGRVGRLVLDSVLPGRIGERLDVFERLGGVPARETARRYWGGDRSPAVRRAWAQTCLPLTTRRPDGDPDAVHRARRIRWNPDVVAHLRHHHADHFADWARLDGITCPTLILAGEHDPLTPASAARRLAAGLVDAETRLHVLPDAGHGAFREAPERSLAVLRTFLAGRNGVSARAERA